MNCLFNNMGLAPYKLYPMGDSAIVVEFGTYLSDEIRKKIRALSEYLDSHVIEGLIEYVPTYKSVTIYYDPWTIWKEKAVDPYVYIHDNLRSICQEISPSPDMDSNMIVIPVCYGGDFGPDLEYVAKYNQMSSEELIEIHSGTEYRIYMIGFAPGFPYMGEMDPRIAAPRRETPRVLVPLGSVGIAGKQTGIYSIGTPGGWQLIGRTPLKLFDPYRTPSALLKSGDKIKFRPISREAFDQRKEE